MSSPLLHWRNVSVTFPSYGSQVASSIFVPDGEIFSNEFLWIDGPSGSGKSTLMHLLKGILPRYIYAKTQGELCYKNQNILKDFPPELDQKCVYVFQNPYSQIVTPRAREEIIFSMECFRFSKDRIQTESENWASVFNLNHLLNQKTYTLSGGQCQRLVLASSLACSPEILLFDEPTAFMDPQGQKDFYELLRKLKGKFTIIVIDHNAPELSSLCDRVLAWPAEKMKIVSNLPDLPSCKKIEFETNSLSFAYPGKEILKNLDFKSMHSKIISIIGSNGSGKTTFFKLLTRSLYPQKGKLIFKLEGISLAPKQWADYTSLIYQNSESQFYFDTVYEELCFKAKHKNLILELADVLGLTPLLSRSPYMLSEGQKRRLSILIAIAQDKPLILYDEPTYGQDKINIDLITKIMLKLRKAKRLQVLITHDVNWARTISDEIYSLENQRLVLK